MEAKASIQPPSYNLSPKYGVGTLEKVIADGHKEPMENKMTHNMSFVRFTNFKTRAGPQVACGIGK